MKSIKSIKHTKCLKHVKWLNMYEFCEIYKVHQNIQKYIQRDTLSKIIKKKQRCVYIIKNIKSIKYTNI